MRILWWLTTTLTDAADAGVMTMMMTIVMSMSLSTFVSLTSPNVKRRWCRICSYSAVLYAIRYGSLKGEWVASIRGPVDHNDVEYVDYHTGSNRNLTTEKCQCQSSIYIAHHRESL